MTDNEAPVTVGPATFEDLRPGTQRPGKADELGNLGLILDVTVPVTVSLGTVKKSIAEILAFGPGQVVRLDRLAGEPVDLEVGGRIVARGEVVVVEEKYGIRVTEIVAAMDRLAAAH